MATMLLVLQPRQRYLGFLVLFISVIILIAFTLRHWILDSCLKMTDVTSVTG